MKKSIDLLKTKLKEKLNGLVKNFYIGDPFIFPKSTLPAIIINPNSTETNILDNQRDEHTHFINVSLVIDAQTYFNATPDTMVGTEFLMETMEGEDSDGNISSNTILGVLRENLNLGSNRKISNISSIDYTVRQRTDSLITLEVAANLEIVYFINRN